MMTNDIQYFRSCHHQGFVKSPFLEIGSAKVQSSVPNLCDLALELGITSVTGADLAAGAGVDISFDFSLPPERFQARWQHGRFATVGIFNVLEHVFDPITVLANALECVAEGGTLLAVTPAVWSLHDYPGDYVRLMPNWYERFAERFGLHLHRATFCWLSEFGITNVDDLRAQGQYLLPTYHYLGRTRSLSRFVASRVLHPLFNTYGVSHAYTNAAIGVALGRPG